MPKRQIRLIYVTAKEFPLLENTSKRKYNLREYYHLKLIVYNFPHLGKLRRRKHNMSQKS